jgi:hypothetical protein
MVTPTEEMDMNEKLRSRVRGVSSMVVLVICAFVLSFTVYLLWRLHPWIGAGRGLQVANQQFNGYEVQVWQRKNDTFVEPFATAVFIRKDSQEWRAFGVGFEDLYHPRIRLEKEPTQFLVFFNGHEIGTIDQNLSAFKRKSDGSSFPPTLINGHPPGNWWLKPQTFGEVSVQRL